MSAGRKESRLDILLPVAIRLGWAAMGASLLLGALSMALFLLVLRGWERPADPGWALLYVTVRGVADVSAALGGAGLAAAATVTLLAHLGSAWRGGRRRLACVLAILAAGALLLKWLLEAR